MKDVKSLTFLLACMLLLSLFLNQPVLAAETDSMANAASIVDSNRSSSGGNIGVYILQILFGGMFIFGGGADGLQDVFNVFNTGLWLLAGIFVGYVAITVVLSARTGEVGRKYNVFMMTARTAFGVFMIVPTANGYAFIQVASMWLILHGFAFADVIWGTFASSDTLAKAVSIAPPTPNVKALVRDVLIASLCMASIQAEADSLGDKTVQMGWSYGSADNFTPLDFSARGSNAANGMLAEMVKNNPDKKIILRAGNTEGSAGVTTSACGTITIEPFEGTEGQQGKKGAIFNTENGAAAINAAAGAVALSSSDGIGGKIVGGAMLATSAAEFGVNTYHKYTQWKEWLKVMTQEHANATQTLLIKADEIANNIILHALNKEAEENIKKFGQNGGIYNTTIKPTSLSREQIVAAIDGLASQYYSDFRTKAVQSYQGGSTLESVLKQANEYGFWMAGYTITQLANLSDSANKIALNVPVSTSNFSSPQPSVFRQFNSRYMSKANQYFEMTELFKNDAFRLPTANLSIQDSIANNAAHQNSSGSPSLWIEDAMLSGINWAINDNEHPIIQIKRLGTLMIASGTAIFVVMTTKLEKVNNGGLYLISMMAWVLLSILIGGGISLSYIFPMIPAVMWTGMLVGLLFMIMELMVIMPIWALTNISLHSGDDFVGNQKIGYTMLLTMVLRAPLMTIGAIMVISLMNVFGVFINSFFTLIYSMAQVSSNGLANIFIGMFVAPMMYAGMVYVSTKEIYSIMHKIPDNTLSLFGGGQSIGSYGEKMSSGSVNVFGQMNNNAISPLNSTRSNLMEHKQAMAAKASMENDKIHREDLTRGNFADEIGRISSGKGGFGNANNGINGEDANNLMRGIMGEKNEAGDDYKFKPFIGSKTDNESSFKQAKSKMIPATETVKRDAISGALTAAQEYKAATNENMSYDQFFDKVNDNINLATFGREEGNKLNEYANVLDAVTGNSHAGEEFLKGYHEKMHDVADRLNVEPSVIAEDYAKQFNETVSGYAKEHGYNLYSGNGLATDFTQLGLMKDEKMGNVGRHMAKASRSYINGQGGMPAHSPSFDRMKVENGKIVWAKTPFDKVWSDKIRNNQMGTPYIPPTSSNANVSSGVASGFGNSWGNSYNGVNQSNEIPQGMISDGSTPNPLNGNVTYASGSAVYSAPVVNSDSFAVKASNNYSPAPEPNFNYSSSPDSVENSYSESSVIQAAPNLDGFYETAKVANSYNSNSGGYIQEPLLNSNMYNNDVPVMQEPPVIQQSVYQGGFGDSSLNTFDGESNKAIIAPMERPQVDFSTLDSDFNYTPNPSDLNDLNDLDRPEEWKNN